jgi:hypothetical protein
MHWGILEFLIKNFIKIVLHPRSAFLLPNGLNLTSSTLAEKRLKCISAEKRTAEFWLGLLGKSCFYASQRGLRRFGCVT